MIAIAVNSSVLISGCRSAPPVVESYPAESAHHITISGVDVHYFDFFPDADETPIVWIHGYSGTAIEAFYIKDHLGSSRRLIAPDLPGSGYSAKPQIDYTLEYYTRFLDEFTRALELDEYILVGHSMGGLIAWTHASQSPPGLRKLVLVAPYGLSGEAGAIPEFLSEAGVLVDYGLELHNETILDLALRINVFHDPSRIPQDLINYLSVSTFHTENAIPALASVTRNIIATVHDTSRLELIEVPTLIIWGAEDRVLGFRYAATFNRRIRESVLQAIPDCGHLPHVEQPEITAQIMSAFLD